MLGIACIACAAFVLALHRVCAYTPKQLLCFAQISPSSLLECGRIADTACLSAKLETNKELYSQQVHRHNASACSTHSFARVNMSALALEASLFCPKTPKRRTVWAVLIVRNDAASVIEWLVWHLLIGVDKVLIYDNESTDNLKTSLQPFINQGLIEYQYTNGNNIQFKSYNKAIAYAEQQRVDWLVVVDVDEYVTLIGQHQHCVHDFLAQYEGGKIGGISLNRITLRSKNGRSPWRYNLGRNITHVIDRGDYRVGRGIETFVKSIIRVNRTKGFFSTPHQPEYKSSFIAVGPDNHAIRQRGPFLIPHQINHAFILHTLLYSLEEWVQKRQRGYADRKSPALQCPTCRKNLDVIVAEYNCKTTSSRLCNKSRKSQRNSSLPRVFPPLSNASLEEIFIIPSYPHAKLQTAMHKVLSYDYSFLDSLVVVDSSYTLSKSSLS